LVPVEELFEPPAPPEPELLSLAGAQPAAQRPASRASPTTRVLVWQIVFIGLSPLDLLGDGQTLSSVAITRADQSLARSR
jgi:hypothetical protein